MALQYFMGQVALKWTKNWFQLLRSYEQKHHSNFGLLVVLKGLRRGSKRNKDFLAFPCWLAIKKNQHNHVLYTSICQTHDCTYVSMKLLSFGEKKSCVICIYNSDFSPLFSSPLLLSSPPLSSLHFLSLINFIIPLSYLPPLLPTMSFTHTSGRITHHSIRALALEGPHWEHICSVLPGYTTLKCQHYSWAPHTAVVPRLSRHSDRCIWLA